MSAAATRVMVIQMVMRRMCPFKFGSRVARRVSPAGEWPLPRAASIPCSNTSIAAEEVMSPNSWALSKRGHLAFLQHGGAQLSLRFHVSVLANSDRSFDAITATAG
jgi:hypothetical protein